MITDSSLLGAIQEICDRLKERDATLFMGAGINACTTNFTVAWTSRILRKDV